AIDLRPPRLVPAFLHFDELLLVPRQRDHSRHCAVHQLTPSRTSCSHHRLVGDAVQISPAAAVSLTPSAHCRTATAVKERASPVGGCAPCRSSPAGCTFFP